MKQITLLAMIAGLGLTACQMSSPKEEQSAAHIPACGQPHDQRDEWMAGMLQKGNSPETIEEIRQAYIKRGSDPDESGSYNAAIALLTGEPNKFGPEATANYKVCFDRFAG